jgi:hypothetical protein
MGDLLLAVYKEDIFQDLIALQAKWELYKSFPTGYNITAVRSCNFN